MRTKVENFLRHIQATGKGREAIRHIEYLGPEKGSYAKTESLLSKGLCSALKDIGIDRLYSHQTDAIGSVKKGENVLISTPTASGKTLVYNLSVFDEILKEPLARALYIFPTKALTQDQLKTIRRFADMLKGTRIRAEIYDGDTPSSARVRIKRTPPSILLTNPDMLHLGILPYHSSWQKFLSGLRFVVIDELHSYRGIFGCHVSHIIRRLRRVCAKYGSFPQFVASSATISNGQEFTRKLTGLDFKIIERSSSPRGARYFMFWDPEGHSPYTDATFLFEEAVSSGLKTIAFAQARKITELIHQWVIEKNPALSGRLSSYRAGYLPEERREIEKRLFSDQLDGVIATSALELGIDVGGLDCCILAGYPGSIISTWQRGGRAGRGEKDSLIVLIGLPDALDKYFLRHPRELFKRGFESITVDENNFPISREQISCAAAELPLTESDSRFYGQFQSILPKLLSAGKILAGKNGKQWFCPEKYPQRKISIRSVSESYSIIDDESQRLVGDIGSSRVFHECHPGAIYLHRGEEYEVIKLDNQVKNVYVRRAYVDYYTQVTSVETITVQKVNSTRTLGSFRVNWGEVEVKEQVVSYEKRRVFGGGLISEHSLNLPPQTFNTTSVWMELPERGDRIHDLHGGLHAIEHASIALLPLFTMCDRWDIGGTSSPFHPQTKGAVIFIHDAYPGGIGLAERAYMEIAELLKAVLKLIEGCQCEDGCPSCVQSPKCGSRNDPLSKDAAVFILKDVLGADAGMPRRLRNVKETHPDTACHGPGEKMALDSQGKKDVSGTPLNGGRIIYFDLETQRGADEVGGWENKHLMRVSVAVVYDSLERKFKVFDEDTIDKLLKELFSADLIVGFNVKRFDWKVLSRYTDIDFSVLKTVDMLEEVSSVLGHRLSLDHLARVNLKEGKTGDGLQAIRWFTEGNIEKLTEYCKHDVEITRKLYELGKKKKYLFFEHRSKGTLRIPVSW